MRAAAFPDRLDPPESVRTIAATLEDAGYDTWCVGGAVRDALLGLTHLDWDLATAARPEEVRRLFRRTIPVGIEFGTIGVLDRHGVMHEVTTFRRDVKTDGRHAVVEFGASLDDDLARRDFTINAIAWSPRRQALYDPFDGRGDLTRRVVRAVGIPGERMREDRLRALRAIRFAGRFDFPIEEETWKAIVESAPHLSKLSAERVKQELEKTMDQVDCPSRSMVLWQRSGALGRLVPAIAAQPDERLAALDYLATPARTRHPGRTSARRTLRLAMLFGGVEAARAKKALKDLRFSNQQVEWIGSLVASGNVLAASLDAAVRDDGTPTDVEVRRWAAVTGRTALASLLRLAAARWGARRGAGKPAPSASRVHAIYRRALHIAYRDPIELADLAIDGGDLMEAGIAPGPALGKILRALQDEVIEDPLRNSHDALLARAAALDAGWRSER